MADNCELSIKMTGSGISLMKFNVEMTNVELSIANPIDATKAVKIVKLPTDNKRAVVALDKTTTAATTYKLVGQTSGKTQFEETYSHNAGDATSATKFIEFTSIDLAFGPPYTVTVAVEEFTTTPSLVW